MSESAVGLLVSATRQNAGAEAIARARAGGTPRPGTAVGGANAPAAMAVADVTVAFCSRREDKPSHDTGAAAGRCCTGANSAKRTVTPATLARMLSPWAGLKASTTYDYESRRTLLDSRSAGLQAGDLGSTVVVPAFRPATSAVG